ncbi:disaggregatase related repeat-containing protein [uncultured Methanomethylovorans sp.]|uniref:disaggregatase related repeat-containing protein n=1 Tax=uncultured Methanomethylovorans sp. TaxID=183759 RepID=UPI0037480C38
MPVDALQNNDEKIPVLINFKEKADADLVREYGGDVKYNYTLIPVVAAELTQDAIDALSQNPTIDFIEPDGQAQIPKDYDDFTLDEVLADEIPWGISRINATAAQALGFKGSGVKVAVIDSGIDYTHPDLKANYLGGYDFYNGDSDPMDDHSHGTHVSGTIAAPINGIGVVGAAPEAKLYGLKVFGSTLPGNNTSYSNIMAGIEWAVNNDADVITMSLSGPSYSSSLKTMCDYAYNKGVVLVGSAGNTASSVRYPAAYDSVIAVSAIDSSNKIASWSCYGPEVDFTAPGVNVKSTMPGNSYGYKDGTSMSAPHVTGAIALLLSTNISGTPYDLNKNGKWDPAEVYSRLKSTAIDLGTSGKDNYYGYGLIDAYAAVKPFVPASVSSTAIYNAVYDNRIRQTSPSTVYSTSTYLDIGKSTSACRDLILFDLSSYKTMDTISKATLSLYWYFPAGTTRTSDTIVEIYRPVAWNPNSVTWNSWTTAGGSWYDKDGTSQGSKSYASVTFSGSTVPGNKYYDFDVTNLVKEYVSGKYKNTGFFLKARTESGNYIAFYSSEWSNAAQRPKLTITSGSTSTDTVPVANAGADKTATTGSAVPFSGSASTDDKGIVSYSWDFDVSNGITSEASGVTATHVYTSAGTYTVTLTVTDTAGQKSSDTLQVVVTSKPANSNTSISTSYSAVYDNRMVASSPTTVYSSLTYLDVGKSSTSSRDVLLFDLSSYKTTDTISKAILSLYWYYPISKTRTSDTVVDVYRPIEWDAKYVTWNSRMSGVLWSIAGGNWYDKNNVPQGSTPYASLTFAGSKVPDNKYYDFNVTQLVQEYVSGKYKNTGFFLKARTESGNYIAFYSSDYSKTAMRPKLTITSISGSTSIDNPPVANAGTDKTAITGSAVTFDGSASTDDKGIASYSWDFDVSNGITSEATGVTATHIYTSSGTYTVTLTVTDTAGQKSTDSLKVIVSSPVDTAPVANAGTDKTATTGAIVTFDGNGSSDDKGITSYSWDFDVSNGITSEASGVTAIHTYVCAGNYTVTLTVTDTAGQKDTDTLKVIVSGSAASVTYSPLYDNRLRESSPSSVLSTTTYLDIGRSTSLCRDVMLFDLSGYNATDKISKAALSLYWYYPVDKTRNSDTVVEIYRPVEWNPNYVSWNYRASSTLWDTAGGNWYDKNNDSQGSMPYASITFKASTVPDNHYYDFDVTQLVQEYINGTYENTGFFLKAKTEGENYIAFYSSEWSTDAQKPKLTINSASGSNSTDAAPVAHAGPDQNATVGSVVSFNGSGSTDDVGITSYSWDFNAADGITSEATNMTVTHVYTSVGNYTVTLTVTDNKGHTSNDTLTVFVSAPVSPDDVPVAHAGPDQNTTVGSVVSFNGSGSTDDVGITSYSWDFNAADGITSEAINMTATHVYASAGNYTVTLTVTDNKGQTSNDTLTVFVSAPVSPDDVPGDLSDSDQNATVGLVTYSPVYDNRLRESSPNSVLSTTLYLDIGKSTSLCRDIILFNLSSYKATDIISKATLSLYWYYPVDATRASDTVVDIYRPMEWDPKYVTWNSRMSGVLWSNAGGSWYDKNGTSQGSAPYASVTFPASTVPNNKYYNFDVTQLVQEYISGKYKNTGFFLKARSENGNYIAFYSSEYSDASMRPKLTVTL